MARWAGSVATLCLMVGVACGTGANAVGHDGSDERALPRAKAAHAMVSVSAGRSHPHGLEADEITRQPGQTRWRAGKVSWTGRGRHPVWRGCQHIYDPTLSRFIFGSSSSS